MLRSVEELEKYGVLANDGPIGHVADFLFDDESWVIRYVVVDTGGWLSSRKVLISPISIGLADAENKRLRVLLDREQIENSPDVDTDMPVSRQYEMRYFSHYSYPCYWGGMGLWGAGSFPSLMLSDMDGRAERSACADQPLARTGPGQPGRPGATNVSAEQSSKTALDDAASEQHDDPHLRSCTSVLHYAIEATDGPIGHLKGFLVDQATWAILQLVVKPGHWWPHNGVVIASDRVSSVNWLEQTVRVELSRAAIQQSPTFDSAYQQKVDDKTRDRSARRTRPPRGSRWG